jgi:hypothetical protein
MAHPETRRAASAKAAPTRIQIDSTDTIHDDVTDRQVSRISRSFLVGYALAATIAQLAFGVAR